MTASKNGLEKAKEFYQQSRVEFQRAKQKNSDVLFRDAAEKGWNAVVLSSNFLIQKVLHKAARTNKERRESLRTLRTQNGHLKRHNFYERFAARAYVLHERCFYDGQYTEDELKENLDKVKRYLRDVEKAAKKP